MGTALTGLEIRDTYEALLKITDNGPVGATGKVVTDGLGNDTPLVLSTASVGIGGLTTGTVSGANITSKFCVKSEGSVSGAGFVYADNTTAANGSIVYACRSRGTLDVPTAVQNGDRLASLIFAGHDGTDLAIAGEINIEVDGAPGSNDMPGRITFLTTPDGSQIPTEKMRISNAGAIKFNSYGSGTNTGTVAYKLAVDASGNVIESDSILDGSGTANYVSKWTDANTLANSQIQDDGTTVGVGQAPDATAKLAVDGAIKSSSPVASSASAWKLGTTNLGGVFVATADYVTVEVNGFIVKLPIAIAPDTQDYYDRVISDGGSFEGVLSYESATTILKSN